MCLPSIQEIHCPTLQDEGLNVVTMLPLVTSSSMRCKAFSVAAMA